MSSVLKATFENKTTSEVKRPTLIVTKFFINKQKLSKNTDQMPMTSVITLLGTGIRIIVSKILKIGIIFDEVNAYKNCCFCRLSGLFTRRTARRAYRPYTLAKFLNTRLTPPVPRNAFYTADLAHTPCVRTWTPAEFFPGVGKLRFGERKFPSGVQEWSSAGSLEAKPQ